MVFLLYHLVFAGLAVMLAQSLNLVWRVNLFSLGHHGFFGIGAYVGVVMAKLALPDASAGWALDSPADRLVGLAFLAGSIVAAGLSVAAVAWILGSLFAEIRGDYFAVITLIFAEILRNTEANWSFVGGALGFEVPYLIFDNSAEERLCFVVFYAVLLLILNFILFVSIRRIDKSIYGVYITAVRDDALAAELSGIDVVRLQTIVFVLAAAVAGATGAIFLHYTTIIVPSDFSFINGLPAVLSIILGRLGSKRCVLAAIFIYTCYEIIKLRFFGVFGFEFGQMTEDWKEALLGLVLITSMTLPVAWRRLSRTLAGRWAKCSDHVFEQGDRR